MKRFVTMAATAVMALSVLSVATPAWASETGAARTAVAIPCSVSPGHYCAKVTFVSVAGGIRVKKTQSTGYTRGAGKGREWFRYSCNAGTCFIVPSATFVYHSADVQLNVNRTFSGSGFFLPCGNLFGVQYRNPAKNAPGPGAVLFHVTCNGARNGIQRS